MEHLDGLNPEQKKAVLQTEGPLLIVAGAGAGKTKTIVHRILHLVQKGVSPENILAVTFTNKAAKEMRERLFKLFSEDANLNRPVSFEARPFVSTFHGLGVHIIRENAKIIGISRNFNIFDRNDSVRAVKEALKTLDLDPKQWEPGRILSVISKEKGKGRSFSDFIPKGDRDFFGKVLGGVWERYEEILKKEHALDFDDLLLKSLELLKNRPEILTRYQNTWRYIHVDEYQDTNAVQYDIARLLAAKDKNICVVGDVDQSIYSWRGADFKNIMRFEKDYPNTTVVLLERNYRSTKTILSAANAIIEKNTLRKDKRLYTENDAGEKITLYGGYDEEDEAYFIARKTKELIGNGTVPDEIAVLYRANFQSRILEEAMIAESVPYQVLGTRFFERKEVKDVLSYLKAALNPDGLSDLRRVINMPPRRLGKVALAKIFSGLEHELPSAALDSLNAFRAVLSSLKDKIENRKPSETVLAAVVESGIKKYLEEGEGGDEEALENIAELVSLSTKYDFFGGREGIEELLKDAALASDQDDVKENVSAVKLMTVHASKGLEFEYVFISGLEDNLFPHRRSNDDKESTEESEEERRLFYVALTRAKKKLYLSYASVRTIFGSRQINVPSEFITDIEDTLIENHEREESGGDVAPRGKVIYLDEE